MSLEQKNEMSSLAARRRLGDLGMALDHLVESVRGNHSELKGCVLYVFARSDDDRFVGRFVPDSRAEGVLVRCKKAGKEAPEGLLPIIQLIAEGRTGRSLAETVVHELAHQLAWEREILSLASGGERGQWRDFLSPPKGQEGHCNHTEVFAGIARELGLHVNFDERIGWARTHWAEVGLARYRDSIVRIAAALQALEASDLGHAPTIFLSGRLQDEYAKFDYWEDFNRRNPVPSALEEYFWYSFAVAIFFAAVYLVSQIGTFTTFPGEDAHVLVEDVGNPQ